ncbi:hypothetical protein ACLOJK_037018 [Asimina triloba]
MKAGPKQLRRWCELLATCRRSSSSAALEALGRGVGKGRLTLEAFENPKAALLECQDNGGGGDGDNREGEASHVPKGCLAVYVGPEMRRFVIPTSYLCSPDFRVLWERVVDEFGFEQKGALRIPCEEEAFEELIRGLDCKSSKKKLRRR